MSGATGAGPAGTSTGTDGGGRGSAARASDPHTTNLKAIKAPVSDASSSTRQGSQGEP